jgi:quercetin dioxygenase-like cupin family protein
MKLQKAVLVVGVVALGVTAFAAEKAKTAVFTPAADVKWGDVPNVPEIKMAAVEGDPAKGPHHSMMKFTAGFASPVHHHTADHHVTVVQGTMGLAVDGVETKLPAGSFFTFTTKQPHQTKCEAGTDCIISVDARGKWDVVAAKEKKDDAKAAAAPAEKK